MAKICIEHNSYIALSYTPSNRKLISIIQKEYEIQILSMSNARSSVKRMGQKPEITGQITSLEELLESYSKPSDLLKSYGKLLKKDAKQMKGAADSLMSAEKRLLE